MLIVKCVLCMGIGLNVDRCWNVRCKYRCATHHFSIPRVWSSNACTFSVVKGYKLVLPRAQRPIHWNTRFHLKHVGYGAIPKSKLTIFYMILLLPHQDASAGISHFMSIGKKWGSMIMMQLLWIMFPLDALCMSGTHSSRVQRWWWVTRGLNYRHHQPILL